MNATEITTATREQLADELAAACEYTEDWETTTMDDLRDRVRQLNEPADPMTAASLAELCDRLNEWDGAPPFDVTSLPTFGGSDVEDTVGVYSWDAEHLLLPGGNTDAAWYIAPRCGDCGEATFHCGHDA